MKSLWLTIGLIIISTTAHTFADPPQGVMPADTVLFERPIGNAGQRLVVARGPDRDSAPLAALRPPDPQLRESFYEERVEIRSPEHAPIVLAARLRVQDGGLADKGSTVLDVLIEPLHICLAMAEGPDLALWQIDIAQASTCWATLRADKPWALAAAAYQLTDKLVAMKLGRNQQGSLTVAVEERLSGQHTLYEETEKGTLRFTTIRQENTRTVGK